MDALEFLQWTRQNPPAAHMQKENMEICHFPPGGLTHGSPSSRHLGKQEMTPPASIAPHPPACLGKAEQTVFSLLDTIHSDYFWCDIMGIIAAWEWENTEEAKRCLS